MKENRKKDRKKIKKWSILILCFIVLSGLCLWCLVPEKDISTGTRDKNVTDSTVAPANTESGLADKEYKIQTEKGIIYHFDGNGVLKVSGSGAVPEFETLVAAQEYYCTALQNEYEKENQENSTLTEDVVVEEQEFLRVLLNVKEIKIEEGITELGANTFAPFYYTERVEVATSVESVSETAFAGTGQYAEHTEWIGITVAEEESNGEVLESADLGEHVTGKLYDDGTLVVTGYGATYSFESIAKLYDYLEEALHCVGWNEVEEQWFNKATSICIEEGVTTLGDYIFAGYRYVYEVTAWNGIEQMGENAFARAGAYAKEDITWNVDFSRTEGTDSAFSNCRNKPETRD